MKTWALTLLFVLITPTLAQGQAQVAEAERHFHDGEARYAAGDLPSALAAFLRSFELMEGNSARTPILYNIAVCQEGLFRYDEALVSYRRYLSDGGRDRIRDVRQRITELEARIGTVDITMNAPSAEVWVDDRHVGTAPGPVSVASGQHVVEVRARGYASSRQQVSVAARTVVPMTFRLERSFSGVSPALFITGAALAVVTAGLGIGFGAAAASERSAIDGRLASADPSMRFQVTQEAIDAMEQNALIADVMFASAGVFGIASLVLIFVTDWGGGGGGTSGVQVRPLASRTGGGLSMAGSW